MDFDKKGGSDGSLNYTEFFVSLYNFCTLTHDTLVRFTFAVMDADGSGTISRDEMFDMVDMLHENTKGGSGPQARRIMDVLDSDGNGDVTLDEFLAANRKVGTLMFPAFRLQKRMRARTMNTLFWRKASKQRQKAMKAGQKDLVELFLDVCKEIDAEAERERAAIEAADAAARALESCKAEERELTQEEKDELETLAIKASGELIDEKSSLYSETGEELPSWASKSEPEEDLPPPDPRSGEWWDEEASLAEEEEIVIPDRPTTPSINLPKKKARVFVEVSTADTLERGDKTRELAAERKLKAEEARREARELIEATALLPVKKSASEEISQALTKNNPMARAFCGGKKKQKIAAAAEDS